VMNTVDALVVPAETSANVLRSAGVERQIAIVPYGVSEESRIPGDDVLSEIAEHRAAGRTIFACVGTVGERKNQAALVDGLAMLPEPARVVCLFAGDGSTQALQALAERRGVAGSVRVLGYRADASAIAKAADWFILPSRSEGQPLSIIEAFRDRVPV